MDTIVLIVILLVVVVVVVGLGSRLISQLHPGPCPTWLIWLLKNPESQRYRAAVLSRLDLSPGLSVLDAGCGPGLLTIPVARVVGPTGTVTGLDIQAGMIERAKKAVEQAGLSNVTFLQAGLGQGKLPAGAFDRALLVTVLGEIPDKPAALREIHASLKPGGFVSITEIFPDPDYQSRRKVKALAAEAGLQVREEFGNWFLFTVNMERPEQA